MTIREHVPLAPLTTFKVGGAARYFAEVADASEVAELFHFAQEQALSVFVLGGGSNILVDDLGYMGLVLKMNIQGISFSKDGDDRLCAVGAGVSWDALVARSVEEECWGVENLSLIWGTVGGAVVQNIGAYGCEVKEVVEWVEVYDPAQTCVRTLTNTECAFGYRDSVFKHEGAGLVIMRVGLRFKKHSTSNIFYKDLAAYFLERGIIAPTIHEVRRAVINIRTAKFPALATVGTAGSFFKNPVVTKAVGGAFLARFPLATHYDIGSGLMKLSAAWIIDHVLHMKGVRVGNVGCFSAQALVIVNYKDATSEEIKNFVRDIQKKCFEETRITLEHEVIFVDTKK